MCCATDVHSIINEFKPGDSVEATVVRENEDGTVRTFKITFKLMNDESKNINGIEP